MYTGNSVTELVVVITGKGLTSMNETGNESIKKTNYKYKKSRLF